VPEPLAGCCLLLLSFWAIELGTFKQAPGWMLPQCGSE